jgi:hypothetical protein
VKICLQHPALKHFIQSNISREAFKNEDHHLDIFASLDDADIMSAVKVWAGHPDFLLSTLAKNLVQRNLFHVDITNEEPDAAFCGAADQKGEEKYGISEQEASYFVFTTSIRNNAYTAGDGNIGILMKNGEVKDIAKASDNSNLEALIKTVKKHITCYSKDLL